MTRLRVRVLDRRGGAGAVDLRVRRSTVECLVDGRCRAVFDREFLRRWLSKPDGPVAVDEVALAGRIVLGVVGILAPCPMPEPVVRRLREVV